MANVLQSYLEPMTVNVLTHVGIVLVTTNSATNFVIYCAMGRDFRARFAQILLPCCRERLHSYFARVARSTPTTFASTRMINGGSEAASARATSGAPSTRFHKTRYSSVSLRPTMTALKTLVDTPTRRRNSLKLGDGDATPPTAAGTPRRRVDDVIERCNVHSVSFTDGLGTDITLGTRYNGERGVLLSEVV